MNASTLSPVEKDSDAVLRPKTMAGFGHVRNVAAIFTLAAVIVAFAWVGYVGTDDQSYARGALGWLSGFPYIGDNQWALRHPVVIPLAISLALFGRHEITLGLPSVVCFLLFLGANYHYLQRFLDARFALLASAFLATTPLFAVYATFSQTVVVETLLSAVSFWLYYDASSSRKPLWPMFASGIAAGLVFSTRETAVVLTLFYGALFLIGFGPPRRYYWMMALGFLLVVGAEVSYFGALTGDPLYRYRIDVHHDTPHHEMIFGRRDVLTVNGDLAGGGAIFHPILSLLLNQEFGLMFWLFVPAAVWVYRDNCMAPEERCLMKLLTGLGVLWLVFVSYTGLLSIVPRFYTVSLWAATIVVVYWLRRHSHVWPPKVAVSVGAALIVGNLFCIYVENKSPAFAERALVAYVRQHDDVVVYTDPSTLRLAGLLLEFNGVADRVWSGQVPPGGLFYFNKKNIDYCERYGCPYSWRDYLPGDRWKLVARIEPEHKLSGTLLRAIGLEKIIPTPIFERLDRPNSGGIFYLRPLPETSRE